MYDNGESKKVFTNEFSGDFVALNDEYKIKREEKDKFYIVSKTKKMEIEPISNYSFLYREYKSLLIVAFMLIVFSFFYTPFLTLVMIGVEYALYRIIKKSSLKSSELNAFFKKVLLLIYLEALLLALYTFFFGSITTLSTIASALALIHFYIGIRAYLFAMQIKFQTVYRIKDDSGRFYAWVERV